MSMDERLLAEIAALYGFSALEYDSLIEAGYISQNHALSNRGERFFCKRYRFEGALDGQRKAVTAIHRTKFHFAQHGIPVILPLRTLAGETFFAWANRCYALFPFVEGTKSRRGEMSRVTAESAGAMQGRIHKAGYNVLDIASPTDKAAFDAKPFWEKSARMLEMIDQKESLGEFDLLAQESLRLKRALAAQNPPTFRALGLADDHLVHGDFQNENFFVDAAGRLTHVYDWELTKVTAREVPLLRTILFACLQRGEDFRPWFTDETFLQAEWYLQSYDSVYPLDADLLAVAIQSRHLGDIYSIWVEEEHYLQDNDRVDLFLAGAVDRLRESDQDRQAFTERICAMIG